MIANIIRNAKKTATGGDPYYSAVSLLLPMDGTNGSTTFTDSGPNAIAVTAVGNAQISTTQSKYGGASAYFDGAGDAVQIPFNAALDLTSGDFTVEGWVYFNAVSGTPTIITPFGTGTTFGGWVIALDSSSRLTFYLSTAANTWNLATNVLFSATAVVTGTWYHFALVRNGSAFTPYLNGIAGTTFTSSSTLYNNSRPLKIGAEKDSNSFPFNGYIDDLRITKGLARFTSSFTPPTQAHPNIYNPYTTLPVSGAALWLDASQQNTIFTDAGTTPVTTSGQSIYQWNDLSGNNRHAVQATSGNRPTWLPPASGQNGLGAISFNGSNQRISTATSGLSAQPFEYYIDFKFNSTTPNDRIVFGTGDRGNFDGNSGGGWNLFSGALLAGGTRTGTSWAMVNCKFNGSSSALRINASQVLSGNTGTGYPTAFSLAGNGSSDWGNITVAEFVVYSSTLSTGDQNLVESYLKTKWGTP